jgi:hypothetical protein
MMNGDFTAWFLVLPLCFLAVVALLLPFKPDDTVFTPRNLMLFVWLNKLVIIPIEIAIVGNKAPFFNPANRPLFTEIIITLVAFGGFVLGWWCCRAPVSKPFLTTNHWLKKWTGVYVAVGVVSVLWLYGSLLNYAAGSLFTYINREIIEQAGGALLGYLANVGQRFLPFGVMLGWCLWQQNKQPKWWQNLLWLLLCLASTLSSNRANMLYPPLALCSIMFAQWQPKRKWLLGVGGVVGIFLLFFFGYVRVQPALDTQQVSDLFKNYLLETDYVLLAHQVYFGTPYQITPLLYLETPPQATWWASLLDPVPILGKEFRAQSGGTVYNLAIYASDVSQDKVIPVAGELFYNGGYGVVFVCHWAFGWVYAKLDFWFKHYVAVLPALAMSIFYLTLLFNATLLLSLSVLVQFLIYNAAPALLLVVLHKTKWVANKKL